MVRELIAAGCSRAPILDNGLIDNFFDSNLGHLVDPFQYSIVWNPRLHRRFPYEEQQIAITIVRVNFKAQYVPSPLLLHIIQYALWLF